MVDLTRKEVAELLNKVSLIHQNFLPNDTKRTQIFKKGYESLIHFMEGYAYERQGAAKAYPKIAVSCISNKYQNGNDWRVPTKDDAEYLWEDYKRIAKNDYHLLDNKTREPKVNKTCNPMNEDEGVISKLASNGISNIAAHIKDLIICRKTTEAHNFLKGIRGIGEKIASLYLRDIAYLAGLDEKSISYLYLLQPIDTWIEQTLKILFGSDVPKKLCKKQELIVNLCKESKVSSISFNQGAWILGSQIATEFGTFKRALTKYNSAQKFIQNHVEEKKGYLRVVENVLNSLRSR